MFEMMGRKLTSDVRTSPKTSYTKIKQETESTGCTVQTAGVDKSGMPAFEINIPNCSDNFGKVLVQISRQINTEELSNLKLMTMANKKIRLQDFDRLKNPGDFLSLLYRRNYYHEKDTSFLEMILEEVGRKDLSKILFRHMMEYGGGDVRLEKDCDSTEHTESPSSSLEGQMSVDGSLDRDDLYDRDEEPMQSSQNSISDDEKLQLLQELA